MVFSVPTNGGPKTGPTLWQRHASRALTWVCHNLLRQPNRKALAGSLGEEVKKLEPEQRTDLSSLLTRHSLIQPKFEGIDPLALEHYHFCKLVSPTQIHAFQEDFDQTIGETHQLRYVAGQFFIKTQRFLPTPPEETPQIETAEETQIPAPIIEPSPAARIATLLGNANRPLFASDIAKELEGSLNKAQLIFELGKLVGRETLVKIDSPGSRSPRYMLSERLEEELHRSVFTYSDARGKIMHVYQRDAERMVSRGEAFRIMDDTGVYSYVSNEGFKEYEENTIAVKTNREALRVFRDDLPRLVERGTLVRGREENSFEICYIHHEATQHFRVEIFNLFAHAYLHRLSPDGFAENYLKLRAALAAGLRIERTTPIAEFLYEARTVASIDGNITAVMVALSKHRKAIAPLRKRKILSADELHDMERCHRQLAFVSHFPLAFIPRWAHSLQNFIHFIYDSTDRYEVFQLLLVRKTAQVRALANNGEELPDSLQREIELVYAPLAESKGFINMANNMRDLVARLRNPEEYTRVQTRMDGSIGMSLTQARAHTIQVAEKLETDYQTFGTTTIPTLATQTRIKEVFAFWKNVAAGKADDLDIIGIRFLCDTREEAYALVDFLNEYLAPIPTEMLPSGKVAIADHLYTPNAGGWFGWRRHFFDPTQKEADRANSPRPISIQILTREMEAKDKMGKAAHWSYKAQIAAHEFAKQHGVPFNKQVFDPAPIHDPGGDPEREYKKYTGEPEHDYIVDRQRARRHVRAFVWPKHQAFSRTRFAFPASGIVPILSMQEGATVEDAVAFKAFRSRLTTGYSHTDVYRLAFDEDKGRIVVKPFGRGLTRAALGSAIPNASLLIPQEGADRLSTWTLSELRGSVTKIRTRLLIALGLEAQRTTNGFHRQHLVRKGKRHHLAKKRLKTDTAQKEVVKAAELRDTSELWLAIALDIIDEAYINSVLGVTGTKVTLSTLAKPRLQIVTSTPSRPGLLNHILQQIPEYQILGATSHTRVQARGVSPSTTKFTLRPVPRQQKRKEESPSTPPTIDLAQLKEAIEHYLPVSPPNTEYTRRMQLTIPAQKLIHWSMLRDIALILSSRDMDIISLDFPVIIRRGPTRALTATILFDSPRTKETDAALKEIISRILPGLLFSIEEIS